MSRFETISATVPIRTGLATVSTDLERLTSDFLLEAKERPSTSPDRAMFIADNLKVFFEFEKAMQQRREDIKAENEKDPLSSALRLARFQYEHAKYLIGGVPYGYVAPDPERPLVYLRPVGSQNFPNSEVDEASFIQRIYKTWRHEREHLIQLADPNFKSIHDRIEKFSNLTEALSFLGVMGVGEIMSYNSSLNTHVLVSIVPLAFTVAQLVTHDLAYMRNNPLELAGREQGVNGKNMPSIFSFEFSK